MELERELKRFVRQIRPGLIGATANANVNLSQLIGELNTTPEFTRQLASALESRLLTRNYVTALTETGLTLEAGWISEAYKRLEYLVLPKVIDELDILSFISRLFDASSDAGWLEKIDRERFAELLGLLAPNREKLVEALAPQVFMSLEILGLRLAGLGYEPLVTHRLRGRPEYQHAFMDVTRHIHDLLDERGQQALPAIGEALQRCTQAVQWIRSRRSVEGASLPLTYRLNKIQQVVRRMELVMSMVHSMLGDWKPQPGVDLFLEISLAEIRRFNMRQFIVGNVELLAYQVTEHTGKTGEHYITRTRSEWNNMLRSAALGGAMIAVLAILKILIHHLHLPLGPEAFAYGLLYASGFIFLLSMGGTLATKQPAMTASTLANAMDEAKSSNQALQNLAEIIVRTIRSQFIALIGNYTIAFPVAAFLCLPFLLMEHPVLDRGAAWANLESLNIFKTLSIWYAAIAGLWLFLSGLLAGAADNWFVFNHVGVRLKQSELLRRLVGPRNLEAAIRTIDHNLGHWVGNATLGFLLGATGAIGTILGLPLDVRHITFSSATFGAALANLRFEVPASTALIIALSVFTMGLINLAVSFSLTLFVVIRSRRIRFSQTSELFKILGDRFIRRPYDFFIPPRDLG